jgi:DNA replicative helicase MCM subunit Mcm2 (Cdc46/Mcm family)
MTFRSAVDQEFMRDYILYARNFIAPEISVEAENVLVEVMCSLPSIKHTNNTSFQLSFTCFPPPPFSSSLLYYRTMT